MLYKIKGVTGWSKPVWMQLTLDVPEQFALEQSLPEIGNTLKMYAAIALFQAGKLSAGAAPSCQVSVDMTLWPLVKNRGYLLLIKVLET